MAYADDLLQDARHLAARGGKKPKQSSLRRAVSTAYYAAFHLLVADFVANYRVAGERPRLGRMFEHRRMSGAAFEVKDRQNPTPIEADIKKMIADFAQLQKERFEADYNVGRSWSPTDVNRTLERAEDVFTVWRRIRKEKLAQHHLMSMFGARHD
ncbi:MAG TPA: HEPN domain-containing protein [Bryobacteraceae bacterium]|nr:HEPN domain-containing protein [Bryobacteraceae bacterium]